jgi:hypothetical protein
MASGNVIPTVGKAMEENPANLHQEICCSSFIIDADMSFKTNLISPWLPELQGKNSSQQLHAHYRLIHVKQRLATAS